MFNIGAWIVKNVTNWNSLLLFPFSFKPSKNKRSLRKKTAQTPLVTFDCSFKKLKQEMKTEPDAHKMFSKCCGSATLIKLWYYINFFASMQHMPISFLKRKLL
jgi:hypothetical protein